MVSWAHNNEVTHVGLNSSQAIEPQSRRNLVPLETLSVRWRDVWFGAAITAALFEIGKLLIGLYIGKQALESTYGAAASLVVLLIWIYYSPQIVLMGAEFTHVYASRRVPEASA